ncbi:MAG TPA: acyl carrier protein [Methanoregulaceae archaeon]|nr:acyl carrier protein [Methanoregulaceae archaeon]
MRTHIPERNEPMSDLLDDIRSFIKTQIFISGDIQLNEYDSLSEMGVIDSIILIQLVDFLEKKYQIEIPLEMITVDNFDTMTGIQQTVMALQQGVRVTESHGYDHV